MSDGFVRTGAVDVNKRIDAETLEIGGVEVVRLRTTPGPMALKLDQIDTNTLYVGEAIPGSSGADPVWRIKKILTAGTVTDILYADGNTAFDNVWNNRTSLSYG